MTAPAPYVTGSHLQLVRKFYTTADGLPANEIRAVTVTREGIALVAAKDQIARLEADHWVKQPGPFGVAALFAPRFGPSALAGTTNGVWILNDGQWRLDDRSPANVIAFADEPAGIGLAGKRHHFRAG